MSKLILASTSPTRRALLDAAGVVYQARAPQFEEVAPPGLSPSEVASFLAYGKAQAAQQPNADEIIIGADQVLDLDGVAIGKYPNAQEARRGLATLSGRAHWLHTGVAILWSGTPAAQREERFVVSTQLVMHSLSDAELDAYIATNEWEGCAGGYRIEGRGACLFAAIHGDYFNILGLPLLQVLSTVR